jgi:sugar-specific transcriptional regulator TrmB
MHISTTLKNLGLSELETSVYLAALELGEALPTKLAEKAEIKRPTLYEVFPKLIAKGLLSETVKGKRKYLVAEDLSAYLEKQQQNLDKLNDALPELRALLATASVKPKILFYEGIEGVKKIYYDHLLVRSEILELVNIEAIHPELQTYITNYYIPERTRRKIPLKMLVNGSADISPFRVRTNSLELREVRLCPPEMLRTPLGLDIYGDNVSITLHRTDTEILGIIIRSPEIAETLRSIFIFIWGASNT